MSGGQGLWEHQVGGGTWQALSHGRDRGWCGLKNWNQYCNLPSRVSLNHQLYPNLCDPLDSSPPGSSVHGILHARILEWVAISFSRDLPDPGIEPRSPALQADALTSEPPGKPLGASKHIPAKDTTRQLVRPLLYFLNAFHLYSSELRPITPDTDYLHACLSY